MFKKIPKNVIVLGLVSFFNDFASEMIYPIVPIFLTSVLHTSIPLVGLIEGIAEATASITKFGFGSLSDYFQKRKPFVVSGYSLAAVSKILIGIAASWHFVLFARIIDRLGKGLRTASRDSLLLENTQENNKGYIFGFHRAFDSLGAVFGPLAALVLLYLLKENIRLTFFVAVVPAILAVITLIIFVKEKHKKEVAKLSFPKIHLSLLKPNLLIFLGISFLFSAGNSSDAFLLLFAKNLGFSATLVVLVYVTYNVSQTLFATPAGKLADGIGAKKVYALGLGIFSLIYFFFGIIHNPMWLWFLFPMYGVYIAFTDGISKAYIAEFIKKEESGTYFGAYYMLTAIGNFLASFIGGILWVTFYPQATFLFGSILAALAWIIFVVSMLRSK